MLMIRLSFDVCSFFKLTCTVLCFSNGIDKSRYVYYIKDIDELYSNCSVLITVRSLAADVFVCVQDKIDAY